MEVESEVNVKRSYFTPTDGYSGLWGTILGFLYFCLFGLSIYTAYVIYEKFINVSLVSSSDNPTITTTQGSNMNLKYLQHPVAQNFGLTLTIIVNSLLCCYLFLSNNANDYKILVLNALLGFACLVTFIEYSLSLKQDSQEELIAGLVATSLGLVLSGTVTVKMLMRSY